MIQGPGNWRLVARNLLSGRNLVAPINEVTRLVARFTHGLDTAGREWKGLAPENANLLIGAFARPEMRKSGEWRYLHPHSPPIPLLPCLCRTIVNRARLEGEPAHDGYGEHKPLILRRFTIYTYNKPCKCSGTINIPPDSWGESQTLFSRIGFGIIGDMRGA